MRGSDSQKAYIINYNHFKRKSQVFEKFLVIFFPLIDNGKLILQFTKNEKFVLKKQIFEKIFQRKVMR
jgi:hypothetical protein